MARDISDTTPIEHRDELVAYLESGSKAPDRFRIGTEHEKFPYRLGTTKPVPYSGSNGIGALLEAVQDKLGWDPIHDRDALIGLFDSKGGGAISLEPGGQFELSGAAFASLHETVAELDHHLETVVETGNQLGIGFLGLGMSPIWTRAETPIMPKSRYAIMTNYMPKVGTLGLDMMYRTSTVQVNLDFASESDMVKKLRVSVALQPLATALFANSPFTEGKPNGLRSMRSQIWLDTDNQRCGMIPFAFESGMGFERYADWALDVPMYFVKRGDTYIDVAGTSFRAMLEGKHPVFPGEKPVLSDWINHLSTLFPEVRLKRYLEMRGADAGQKPLLNALPALWTGLLYDQTSLDAAWDVVKAWTSEERDLLRRAVPRQALHATIRRHSLQTLAREVLAIARHGLARRALNDARGNDETVLLEPLERIVESGQTEADRLLGLFHGAWKEQIDPVFKETAFR